MHYFITGHTGFKGSWLTMLLSEMGHEISGYSLEPIEGSHFDIANVSKLLKNDFRDNILNYRSLENALLNCQPDVVIHLAAQPLVRLSYQEPRNTFETNIIGTLNLLQSLAITKSVKAVLVITTDKVYRNDGRYQGYIETDSLGGDDPYSSSKAAADLLTQSWVTSFSGPPTAIARAGNVIGGGDVCQDRLLVDLIRSFTEGNAPIIRNPDSVRPWQHVLDCLNGYLDLVDALLTGQGEGQWNFGPSQLSSVTVAEVAERAATLWGTQISWLQDDTKNVHEAQQLTLNSSKSQKLLGWKNLLEYPESLEWTIDWYKLKESGIPPEIISQKQISSFLSRTNSKNYPQ